MTQFPYETYNELVQVLRERKNEDTMTIDITPEEKEMYISYTYPVTDEDKNPTIPDQLEFEGFQLIVQEDQG